MAIALSKIVALLDGELNIADFRDSSNNGLQVENSGRVSKICCGVDASMEFFEEAGRRGADMLVCHHGISWGDSLKRITDLNYRRGSYLLAKGIALYACHLPLDAHPRLGNNALICKALKLRSLKRFGVYQGRENGFEGRLAEPLSFSAFQDLVRKTIAPELQVMDFGRRTVKSVAVVSGGGAQEAAEAGRKGVDVYISGEPALSAYSQAQEYGLNVIFAGHYATEVFGVRALAQWLRRRLKIKAEFVDLKIPY